GLGVMHGAADAIDPRQALRGESVQPGPVAQKPSAAAPLRAACRQFHHVLSPAPFGGRDDHPDLVAVPEMDCAVIEKDLLRMVALVLPAIDASALDVGGEHVDGVLLVL